MSDTVIDTSPGLSGSNKKMSMLCWFPWYPKDWLTSESVGFMNDSQIVAYFSLLNRQWLCRNGVLPDDLGILSKYARHDLTKERMKVVLDRFPIVEGGRANPRLYAIYQEQLRKHKRRSELGHIGGKASSKAISKAEATGSGSGSVLHIPEELPEESQERNPLIPILQAMLNEMFRRPATQAWSYLEESSLVNVAKTTTRRDIEIVYRWYRSMTGDKAKYRPQSVQAMLDGWGKHLDKARADKRTKPSDNECMGRSVT